MSLFPVLNGLARFDGSDNADTDRFSAGIRYTQDGAVRSTPSAGTMFNQGIPMSPSGQVSLLDATAGLPADVTWLNGLPISGNKVCVSMNAASVISSGTPHDSAGAVASTGFFTPAYLFLSGEQGVWYDPSDLTTLFQDSAGTTPVTAIEQPVGLMLDKSKGLVLGSELVTNGDFSSGTTGWTASNATLSVVSGALQITGGTGGNGYAYQAFSTQANNQYLVTFDTTFGTETNALCWIGTSIGASDVASLTWTVAGSKTLRFTAVGSTTYIRIGQNTPTTGLTLFFDNVSVKLLPGNHATQATSTKRPLLSARVNLLTKTEQFDDVVWTKTNITVTPNSTVAPNGTTTADTYTVTTTAAAISWQDTTATGTSLVYSIYAKQNTGPTDANSFAFYNNTTATLLATMTVNYSTGVVTQSVGSGATATSVGNGWWRISIPITSGVAVGNSVRVYPCFIGLSETAGESAFIWGADLRVTNTGVNLPVYQAVNTSTDYATAGFPLYLKFDGVDDAMASNSIDFTATDKMTVWGGVRKLSDAAAAILTELSVNNGTNPGAFYISAPEIGATYGARIAGNLGYNSITYAAPITNVIALAGNLAAATVSTGGVNVRYNGIDNTSGAILGSMPGGNFGNYPLYVGARNQTSLYYNGNLYSLIVRGAQSSASQISATETYVNGKTKAY